MNKYIKIIKSFGSNILPKDLEKLKFNNTEVKFVLCYISPYLDFTKITNEIKSYFGEQTVVLANLTAGELCSLGIDNSDNVYLQTNDKWDSIVIQSFSSDMFESVELLTIDLSCQDIKTSQEILSVDERIQSIENSINQLSIKTDIDYTDTLAFTLIDGLSKSENFFIEAIYNTGKFQCQLIGGSTGGKLDFQNTLIFNNDKVISDIAVIALIKMKKNIKFGIFKSQNFEKLNYSFEVLEANVTQRYIKTIIDNRINKSVNIIDYLCDIFKCKEQQLQEKFLTYAFGLVINNEPYIRSVASVDLVKRKIYFYCDIDFGDTLYIFKTNDFISQTTKDYKHFLQNKPSKPITGIINDCILRRLINTDKLDNLNCFNNIPFIGFSTFGELLGININQTLTSVFFFENNENQKFHDDYIDNFINNYATFKLFFKQRKINALQSTQLKENYQNLAKLKDELEYEKGFLKTVMDSQKNLVITSDGVNLLSANQAYFDFYNVKTIQEFVEKYGSCTCDTFKKDSTTEYIKKHMGEESWFDYVNNRPNQIHKTIIVENDEEYIFTITTKKSIFDGKNVNTAVFTNITEQEKMSKQLKEKTKKIETLLNNAGQGFLTFNKQFIIDNEYSKECIKYLGKNIENKDITKILFPTNNDNANKFKIDLLDALDISNPTAQTSMLSLLPNEIILNRRALKLEYKILDDNNIMLIITNISAQKKLEKKVKQEQENLKMIVTIVSDSDTFYDIKKDFEYFSSYKLEYINTNKTPLYNINELYRTIHTFKGAFLQLFMNNTAKLLHEVENKLSEFLSEDIAISNKELLNFLKETNFDTFMENDLNNVTNLLGKRFVENDNFISIDKKVIKDIETQYINLIQSNNIQNKVAISLLDNIKYLSYKSLKSQLKAYPRLTYQIAQRFEKEIYEFEIIGDDDILISDKYKPFIKSLIHLFRNSVDHGIEIPEKRVELNKDEIGTISCSFNRYNNMLQIIISDDGAGIDIEKIKDKIKNSVNISILTESDIQQYIFKDNLSTKEQVTDISGRGVGMSAVKAELDKLNGTIKIQSKKNIGTTFVFEIPLSDNN